MRFRFGIASLVTLVAMVLFAFAASAASAGENGGNGLPPQTRGPAYQANPSGPPVVCNDLNNDESIDEETECRAEPQATNVPYLAWRGEELRLVKCLREPGAEEGDIAELLDAQNGNFLAGNWTLERWSGVHDGDRPRFEGPDATEEQANAYPFEGSVEGVPAFCWAAHVVSAESGLAMFKLTVDLSNFRGEEGEEDEEGNPSPGFPPFSLADTQVLKHQVLAGWMTLNAPTLCEVNFGGDVTDPTASAAVKAANRAAACGGANQGTGDFLANAAAGEIQVLVTGTLTLEQSFGRDVVASVNAAGGAPLAGGATARAAILPTDWPALARGLARSPDLGYGVGAGVNRERDPDLWDIEDDNTARIGHVPDSICPLDVGETAAARAANRRDAVDNCLGGDEFSNFSRYFGDVTSPFTIGPFDPLRPETSLLTDGVLDAFDAPMPPARIDVSIAAGGFGSLGTGEDVNGDSLVSDKHVIYSRDGTGAGTEHNLYNPFYGAFIPSRAAEFSTGWTASGTDSAFVNNNFTGYLFFGIDPVNGFHGFGFYHYWETLTLVDGIATDTDCLLTRDAETGEPIFRQTPEGPQSVALYTDEDGEGRVKFYPGYNFDPSGHGITVNNNGGCDLQGINPLATARINAVARYPYQPTGAPDAPSANTLTKRLLSRFNKVVQCFPKGDGSDDKVICVAHLDDIDGEPFRGELVCARPLAGGATVDPYPEVGPSGTIHNVGSYPHLNRHGNFAHGTHQDLIVLSTGVERDGEMETCVRTDRNGNAGFVIFGPPGAQMFVSFLFPEEGIQRCVGVTMGVGGGPSTSPRCVTTGTTGTGGGGTGTTTGGTTTGGTTTGGTTTGGTTTGTTGVISVRPVAKRAMIAPGAKIVTTKKGRYLVFSVKPGAESQKSARVQIRFVGKRAKVIGTQVRTVRTNYVIRVKLVRGAKTVKLQVVS